MILNKIHSFQCEVPFDLVDAGKFVHHPNYMVLYERARHHAMKLAGYSFTALWKEGLTLALTENRIQYFKPASLGEEIVILTSLIEAGAVRLEVIQRMYLASQFKVLPQNGFFESEPREWEGENGINQVKMTLACVTLDPIKGTRLPKPLLQAFHLGEFAEIT